MQSPKETAISLDQWRTAVGWDGLPHMIQGAIAVALELDAEYVWIDSFVILRDKESRAEQIGSSSRSRWPTTIKTPISPSLSHLRPTAPTLCLTEHYHILRPKTFEPRDAHSLVAYSRRKKMTSQQSISGPLSGRASAWQKWSLST